MTDEPTLIDRLRTIQGELRVNELRSTGKDQEIYARWRAATEQAADALEEWDQAFELYWTANRRCTALYNAAHPGSEGTLPDQGKMIDWLCETIEKLRRGSEA